MFGAATATAWPQHASCCNGAVADQGSAAHEWETALAAVS
jgi:hypothetical protein